MKSYYKYCLLLYILCTGVSCKKYLNVTPDNVGTLDYAFRNRNEAENYLFTCYATLQQLNDQSANVGFTTSSEIIYPNDLLQHPLHEDGFNIIRGLQNANAPALNFWDGSNGGLAMYNAIRHCNIMLENIDKPVDLKEAEKKRWIAETKFLKAYYHYYLFRLYGPIPIVDVNQPITASASDVRVQRQPVDSVVHYIVNLLDEVMPDLPPAIENQAQELGRITRTVAMSVKAEVLTTAASPLFNGNPDYAGFNDKTGSSLFPTEFDAGKWQLAAQACKAAITECEARGLKLYKFLPPATIGNLTDSLRQVLTIQNAVTERWELNQELIWALTTIFHGQEYCIPRMTSNAVANNGANPAYFAVPLSTGELFYSDNGVPINEDKNWSYADRYTLQTGDAANRYYIEQGYTTVKAHFRREPRFYASIGFDGGIWYGNGVLDQDNARYVQARGPASLAGPKDIQKRNITGYWPKKLANYLTVYDNGFTWIDFRMPLMRLAGLYLLYAETLNEVSGPGAEVYTYIDKVRARAGLTGVQNAWTNFSKNPAKPNSKEGLRQIIHQERRNELCFEGQSGWDLRRWKELQNVLSVPLQGWSINEEQALNYYRPRTVLEPVFNVRDYLFPIRTYDLIVNNNLVQTPYW
jgi:hypothetical protein